MGSAGRRGAGLTCMTTEGATSTSEKTLRPLSGSSSTLRVSTTWPSEDVSAWRSGTSLVTVMVFVLAADRKGNVYPGRLLNEDDDVFPVYALESLLFNGEAIVAGDEVHKGIQPGVTGGLRLAERCSGVGECDAGAYFHRAVESRTVPVREP